MIMSRLVVFFFFKQKTAYDMRISDWSSDGALPICFAAIADYHANRVAAERESPGSYRPLAPEALYLTEAEWAGATKERPIHIVTPFDVPPAATVVDLESFAARDFTPERTADLNVYDKVADHLSDERRQGRRTIIAHYSGGARARLSGLQIGSASCRERVCQYVSICVVA